MFFLISGEDNAWKTPKYGEKSDKIGLFGQIVAERAGFEPAVRLPVHMISSHAPSATQTPLHRYF
jgi:hypothetical protein